MVINFDGTMDTPLITHKIDVPHAIALDAEHGVMYWTDCGRRPHIARAGMDGSKHQILIDTEIDRPVGLTLDFTLNRIYWCDSKLKVISSCTFDGSDCRQILQSAEFLSQPFSLATFEDTVYWTDEKKILMANKFNGSDLNVLDKMNTVCAKNTDSEYSVFFNFNLSRIF